MVYCMAVYPPPVPERAPVSAGGYRRKRVLARYSGRLGWEGTLWKVVQFRGRALERSPWAYLLFLGETGSSRFRLIAGEVTLLSVVTSGALPGLWQGFVVRGRGMDVCL